MGSRCCVCDKTCKETKGLHVIHSEGARGIVHLFVCDVCRKLGLAKIEKIIMKKVKENK